MFPALNPSSYDKLCVGRDNVCSKRELVNIAMNG